MCNVWCRFVGWITNFIRQRHRAAASLVNSYSRLTFVRRMPPSIRSRLQQRQQNHNMNTSMRGYIAPYTPHTGRGSGLLSLKPANTRNSKALNRVERVRLQRYTQRTQSCITPLLPDIILLNSAPYTPLIHSSVYYTMFHYLILCTNRYILQIGLDCQDGGTVRRRITGVLTAGVQWKAGKHCLYQDGRGGPVRFGTVINMYEGLTDTLDPFVIFELENKPIIAYTGHYCSLSQNGYTTVFALSTELTWKCKVLVLPNLTLMGLPIIPCTARELIELR